MFEHLLFRNFQNHERKIIHLDPLITTLVGPNDSGKSAILRGLRWICLNRPPGGGTRYIRNGADWCSGELYFDGHHLVRTRRPKKNIYKLDGKVYNAIGTGSVPEPIALLLNVSINNFQHQLSQHFWFSESPGFLSKELNKIVNLSAIDSLAQIGAMRLREERAKHKVLKEQYQKAKKDKKELSWVLELDKDLKAAEVLQEQIQSNTEEADELNNLMERHHDITERIKEIKEAIKEGEGLSVYVESLTKDAKELKALRSITKEIKTIEERICQARTELRNTLREQTNLTKGKCPICKRPIRSEHSSCQTST